MTDRDHGRLVPIYDGRWKHGNVRAKKHREHLLPHLPPSFFSFSTSTSLMRRPLPGLITHTPHPRLNIRPAMTVDSPRCSPRLVVRGLQLERLRFYNVCRGGRGVPLPVAVPGPVAAEERKAEAAVRLGRGLWG